jgi:flagellar FliL protein
MSDDKPEAAPKKKKGGLVKKLIFFVIVPLVLIGAGVGGGIYAAGAGMVGGGHSEKKHGNPEAPKLQLKEHEEGPTDLPESIKPDPEIYKSTYYPLEQPFTSNLADTDGFLQVGLGVSTFYDTKVMDNIKDSEMPVRSAVLEVLAQQSADALNTPEGKAALRKKLKDAINHVLHERAGFGGIDDVYFTSFIIS